MTCAELTLNSDNELTLTGVYNASTSTYINDAVIELTMVDAATGVELTGQSWPLTMVYVTASNGNYTGTLQDTIIATDGQEVTANISIVGDGLTYVLELDFTFVTGTAATLSWTSRDELERMFGRSNVAQWADLENNESATDISQQIQYVVDEATEEAKDRLNGSSVVVADLTCVPKTLRKATTRLAGVLLYSSRGIKDAPEEGEGRNRLTWHQKMADKFFAQVRSGVLRLSVSTAENAPAFIVDEDSEDEDEIIDSSSIFAL